MQVIYHLRWNYFYKVEDNPNSFTCTYVICTHIKFNFLSITNIVEFWVRNSAGAMHPVMMLMVAWQNIEGELSTSQFWEKIFRTIISQSRILELCVQAWGHIFLHQIEEGGIHVVSRRCQFRGLHKFDSICLC